MISARDAFADTRAFSRERARPMAPDDRRAAIVDAVIPLIREQGRDVSTRQIAEAAGVAEGTIFRAFGDKESIIQAAIERLMDPEPVRDRLRGVDPEQPTEVKIAQVLGILRDRLEGFVGFMHAIGMHGPPPGDHDHGAPQEDEQWLEILARIFSPQEVAVPIPALAFYLRMLAFGSALPVMAPPYHITTEELAQFVLHGVTPRRKDS